MRQEHTKYCLTENGGCVSARFLNSTGVLSITIHMIIIALTPSYLKPVMGRRVHWEIKWCYLILRVF